MNTARGWMIALLAGVLVAGTATAARGADLAAEPRVTVELHGVKIADALRVLFDDTPYAFSLGSQVTGEVTLVLNDVPWPTALRAVLNATSPKLTYRQDGNVFIIAAAPDALRSPQAVQLATPEYRLLYVTQFGGRTQVRLRTYPDPGREEVIWKSREGVQIRYLLPSPAATWVAIMPGEGNLLVVDLSTGETQLVDGELQVKQLRWQDRALSLLAANAQGLAEWSYSPDEAKLTRYREHGDGPEVPEAVTSFLTDPYRSQIAQLQDLLSKGLLPDLLRVEASEAALAILRGNGLLPEPVRGAVHPAAPVEAVFSPDGRYLALTTGLSALHLVTLGNGPTAQIVGPQGTALSGPRWSADSEHLIYIQRPLPSAPADPGRRGTQDPPPQVRMYNPADGKTKTMAIGEMAFLLPPAKDGPGDALARPPRGD